MPSEQIRQQLMQMLEVLDKSLKTIHPDKIKIENNVSLSHITLNTSLTLWPGYLAVQVVGSSWPPSVMPRTDLYQEARAPAPDTLITRSDRNIDSGN